MELYEIFPSFKLKGIKVKCSSFQGNFKKYVFHNLQNILISPRKWFCLIPSSKRHILCLGKQVDRLSYAGAERFPNVTYRLVDVRDVANAHILAFEKPSASGRYCLVGRVIHCSEVMKMLRELFPELNLPEK